MEIEILYVDGCPHVAETRRLVREILQRLEVEATVETIEVATDAEARELDFRGSPSVRVDGTDIQSDLEDRTTVGRGCRVYSTPEGASGIPPATWVEQAIEDAATN